MVRRVHGRCGMESSASPPVASALPLLGALLLAAVHVATPALHFLRGTPRSTWLSIAGGVSVAYVFVHLLPEVAEGQRAVAEAVGAGGGLEGAFGRHVWVIALVGLAAFHGLDKVALRSRGQRAEGEHPADTPAGAPTTADGEADPHAEASEGVFWVHMGSFGVYNALVGYLLVRGERESTRALALFAVAMALHFVVTDYGLDEHHPRRYERVGRWLLVGALALGVGLGYAVALSEAVLAALVAFLAGGVVLNVLKEEVPGERQSRFWAFAGGMAGYALLLLAF